MARPTKVIKQIYDVTYGLMLSSAELGGEHWRLSGVRTDIGFVSIFGTYFQSGGEHTLVRQTWGKKTFSKGTQYEEVKDVLVDNVFDIDRESGLLTVNGQPSSRVQSPIKSFAMDPDSLHCLGLDGMVTVYPFTSHETEQYEFNGERLLTMGDVVCGSAIVNDASLFVNMLNCIDYIKFKSDKPTHPFPFTMSDIMIDSRNLKEKAIERQEV